MLTTLLVNAWKSKGDTPLKVVDLYPELARLAEACEPEGNSWDSPEGQIAIAKMIAAAYAKRGKNAS